MAEDLIEKFGYLGIILLLVLGGLGLPVPEEAPIILAAILSKKGAMWAPMAFGSCVIGVLIGDFVVYGLGYFYGERVLSFRLTRKFLTKAREAQIKGYFQRHGLKILIVGRFAVGFRTAAYLTAGILRHPPLRLLFTDLFAVMLSTPLMFGLGWAFAHQIEAGIQELQQYLALILALTVVSWLLLRYYRARKRGGQPIGPPIYEGDEAPLPPGDLAQPRPKAPPSAESSLLPRGKSGKTGKAIIPDGASQGLDARPLPEPSTSPSDSTISQSR